jgi:hypothetical protein
VWIRTAESASGLPQKVGSVGLCHGKSGHNSNAAEAMIFQLRVKYYTVWIRTEGTLGNHLPSTPLPFYFSKKTSTSQHLFISLFVSCYSLFITILHKWLPNGAFEQCFWTVIKFGVGLSWKKLRRMMEEAVMLELNFYPTASCISISWLRDKNEVFSIIICE